eukprot:NODE_1063_length_1728_cov_91.893985_g939_i0.p1 GENE.NODE_1063_length_1728_cov_91.893985_g939_i0~~NODE_1063_length_1728_cov_91.893985_g939_i0.p1  ORF type:complete len:291 (+),score=43.22 NODE_1063_length_1728_cov_91.893985_g939_i0:93-965(+)
MSRTPSTANLTADATIQPTQCVGTAACAQPQGFAPELSLQSSTSRRWPARSSAPLPLWFVDKDSVDTAHPLQFSSIWSSSTVSPSDASASARTPSSSSSLWTPALDTEAATPTRKELSSPSAKSLPMSSTSSTVRACPRYAKRQTPCDAAASPLPAVRLEGTFLDKTHCGSEGISADEWGQKVMVFSVANSLVPYSDGGGLLVKEIIPIVSEELSGWRKHRVTRPLCASVMTSQGQIESSSHDSFETLHNSAMTSLGFRFSSEDQVTLERWFCFFNSVSKASSPSNQRMS